MYTELVKKNCIKLRHQFGDSTAGKSIEERHALWSEYVNNSDLTEEEKAACKVEFLNTKDKRRYKK